VKYAGAPGQFITRRQLLIAGGAGALGTLALGAAGDRVAHALGGLVTGASAPTAPLFHTRPDLRIPSLSVAAQSPSVAPGLLFLAPYNAPGNAQAGAVIVDGEGEVIWEQPLAGLVTTDFRVQRFAGRPSLTWWQGTVVLGHGVGHYVVADASYQTLATINAGNGRTGDLHEFLLTDRGTALLTSYLVTTHDLRAVGGSATGTIQDAMFQEIDIATGRVLLEWHSLDHIPITESYWGLSSNWDYVHLNSIAVDTDNNLLVSSRNTHTIYKLDRSTGAIIWRLGGKHSDFSIGPEADFAWQHDARRQPDGTITMFDNGDKVSRAISLNVDEVRRLVTLRRAFSHPANLFASSQGNVQVLPNGNVLVGWGAQPYVSEFASDGHLLFDARLPAGYVTYRAYRVPWTGTAAGTPAIAIERGRSHNRAFVSWNGDTRVTRWIALTGPSESSLTPIGSVARTGFETGMRLSRDVVALAVRGVDAGGATIGTSALLRV
jgi:hypothetical protein